MSAHLWCCDLAYHKSTPFLKAKNVFKEFFSVKFWPYIQLVSRAVSNQERVIVVNSRLSGCPIKKRLLAGKHPLILPHAKGWANGNCYKRPYLELFSNWFHSFQINMIFCEISGYWKNNCNFKRSFAPLWYASFRFKNEYRTVFWLHLQNSKKVNAYLLTRIFKNEKSLFFARITFKP